jgi:hypothetical protein
VGHSEDGTRQRRKVGGTTKAAVLDRLKDLHKELDKGLVSQTNLANNTVRQAAGDCLSDGLEGRTAKTIKKNRNVLEPILKVIGARKLRELTAGDVRRALASMASSYSSAPGDNGSPGAQARHPARRRQ